MKYSSRRDTLKHSRTVRRFMLKVIFNLLLRAFKHDRSKLRRPEKYFFDIYTPRLADTAYGSREYKQYLSEMKPALDHHYKKNRHHPEHFEEGIKDMDICDLIEMLCDWYASTLRTKDGSVTKSIWNNQERFKYSNDIRRLLLITYRNLFLPQGRSIAIDGSPGQPGKKEN